jgi:hypothetical protein
VKGYLDATDKKNEIRLLLKHPSYKNKVIVVVEGNSDLRLFRSVCSLPGVEFEPIDGKKELLKSMKELYPNFPNKILAICDADHEHLLDTAHEKSEFKIFMTDYHDAEIMMMQSSSLNSFISEYSQRVAINELSGRLLENVFEPAYIIGLLRWANTKEMLNINFKGLNFNLFSKADKAGIILERNKLFEELIKRSKLLASHVDLEYLENIISKYHSNNGCKLQVCCGHDVTNFVSIIYRQKWASVETNMDIKKVESSLRLSYKRGEFQLTNLFKEMSEYLKTLGISEQAC